MPRFVLPRVIGHRGAAAFAPENSLEGIREAARRGASWVEVDAKLTADGVVVLMHDDSLDRTTNGRGEVAKTNYRDISGLDAGSWFGPDWRQVRVPRMSDALALLCDLDMHVNIEIKPCRGRESETARAVVDIVDRHWPITRDRPLLSSFSRESLSAAAAADGAIPRGLLIWEYAADWADAAEDLGCVTVHCADQHLTPAWAGDIQRGGYGLAVYTVNDRVRAKELAGWGVQCFITDRPDVLIGLA